MILPCDQLSLIEVMIKVIQPQLLQEKFGELAIRNLQSLIVGNRQPGKMITIEEACVTPAVKEKESQLAVQTTRIIHLTILPPLLDCHRQINFTQSREVVMLEDLEKLVIKYFMEVVT